MYFEPVEYVTYTSVTIEDGGESFILPVPILVPITPAPTLVPIPTVATITATPSTLPLTYSTPVSYSPTLSTSDSTSSITQLTSTSTTVHSSSSSYASGSKSPAIVSGTAIPNAQSNAKSKAVNGATIGLIIAVILLLIALIALICYLLRKRFRRQKKSMSKGKQRELPTTAETPYWREDREHGPPSIPEASHQPLSRSHRRGSIFSKIWPPKPAMEEHNDHDHDLDNLDRAFQRNHDEWRITMQREMDALAPNDVNDPYYVQ